MPKVTDVTYVKNAGCLIGYHHTSTRRTCQLMNEVPGPNESNCSMCSSDFTTIREYNSS